MVAIVWFRNDLRITDNLALDAAIKTNKPILPIFIYDKFTSRALGAASKWWLHHSLIALQKNLKTIGADLIIKKGNATEIIENIVSTTNASNVFWNRRYDKNGIKQDTKIKEILHGKSITCKSFNSSLLFEPHTIKNKQGGHFKVFSAFWKHCLNQPQPNKPIDKPQKLNFAENSKILSENIESLELFPNHSWINNLDSNWEPGEINAQNYFENFLNNNLRSYTINRDYPLLDSTSKLSPYLRFGEISPRQMWHTINGYAAASGLENDGAKFISELGWREFAYHTLFHQPDIATVPLNTNFANFPYENNEAYFKAWCKGLTGYPIVDAGMRELWQTGYMHNRVRMITASFLVKHLLQPWQKGEQWFWDTLVDADYASNPFSWQWVAGCGADAAPYFRIFNPIIQGEKFDPKGEYVKKWIPELKNMPTEFIHQPWLCKNMFTKYPKPIVDHAKAREKALNLLKTHMS
jgi:deoxyribodipyrimidine photo-lyase